MIVTEREISIYRDFSKINEKIVVYRGDYEIQLKLKVANNRYSFLNGVKLLESEYAYCAQMVILTPVGDGIFSEPTRCIDGIITFKFTKEMIDGIREVGAYSFQIRLFDSTMTSRITLPPIENGIEVREPITSEDSVDALDNAAADFAILRNLASDDIPEDIFDENGDYIVYNWVPGTRITADKLNRMENAIRLTKYDFDDLSTQQSNNLAVMTNRMNNLHDCVSVEEFGIEPGYDVDVAQNTLRFQEMIDFCKNTKTIVFPSGVYVFNEVNLGEKNNISIRGTASPFASFAQKDIYTGNFSDNYTRIICNADPGKTFFEHKSCILILENIAFYNLAKDVNGNFIEQQEAKTNILMQHTRSEDAMKNIEKGKAFCLNCAFYGWKVVFGSDFTMPHLEEEWGTGKIADEYEYFKQSCVLASRCRFTRNGIAVNQSVDGRLVDCSFNKNDYAIVLRENSGFTTIIGCRIEWNNYDGIYCENAHEVTIDNCEFDCNGHAGLYACGNTNSNFSGIFRRNGANVESEYGDNHKFDYRNNVHIYALSNINCIFTKINTCVKATSDVGGAPERPSNCTNFSYNQNCIIAMNNLMGCTKGDKEDANQRTDNVNCVFEHNMMIRGEDVPEND